MRRFRYPVCIAVFGMLAMSVASAYGAFAAVKCEKSCRNVVIKVWAIPEPASGTHAAGYKMYSDTDKKWVDFCDFERGATKPKGDGDKIWDKIAAEAGTCTKTASTATLYYYRVEHPCDDEDPPQRGVKDIKELKKDMGGAWTLHRCKTGSK